VQRSVCKAKRSIFLKPFDKCKDMSVKQRGDFLAALGKVQRNVCKAKRSTFMQPLAKCKEVSVKQRGAYSGSP